jgi:hypothetical protein
MAHSRLLFDIETNSIDFDTDVYWLDQVQTVLCMVVKDLDTGNTYQFYDTHDLRILGTQGLQQGLKLLEQADEWVGHNIIAFDIPVLEKLFGIKRAPRILDTLVLSRLLYTDRSGGHSLESFGERLGLPKLDSPGFGAFTPGLLTYCTRDVELNARVLALLEQEVKGGDWGSSIELEHKIADIMFRQERLGMAFNLQQAIEYTSTWADEIAEIDVRLGTMVGPRIAAWVEAKKPFNINGSINAKVKQWADTVGLDTSLIAGPFQFIKIEPYDFESKNQQKDILLRLGWKPVNLTAQGFPQLDESILNVGEVGSLLMRRNVLSHRRSQVQGWIDRCDSQGRVHGGANPCGTNTHRMRHKVIVNVPKVRVELGKEMRGLFVAAPGKILAGYDAKQLELRILAHYIGDQDYVERVTTTDKSRDAHVLAAAAAGSGDRDLGKNINYALIYGAGDRRLGSLVGGGSEGGERIRAELYRSIPGLERLIRAAKTAAQRGHLIGLDGRKFYIRGVVSPLNTLIQGGGSIYMKRVTAMLDSLGGELPGWNKVLDMHDEAQWEIPDTEYDKLCFKDKVEYAFQKANEYYNLRCPQEPDVKFGYTWAETH